MVNEVYPPINGGTPNSWSLFHGKCYFMLFSNKWMKFGVAIFQETSIYEPLNYKALIHE